MKKSLLKIKRRIFPIKRGFFGDYSWQEATNLMVDRHSHRQLDHTPSDWKVISGILYSSISTGKFDVVDLGGGLANKFYECLPFMKGHPIDWKIVELPHVVKKGIPEAGLSFHEKMQKGDTLLMSASIQYMENPYEILESSDFEYVIINRVLLYSRDRIVLRKTEEEASPCHLLDKNRFYSSIRKNYDIILDAPESNPGYLSLLEPDDTCDNRFLILKRK